MNIGHNETGARFATNRLSFAERESLRKKRRSDRAEEQHQLKRVADVFDAQPALGETEPTEKWVALHPNKFNRTAKYCWRLDLDFN